MVAAFWGFFLTHKFMTHGRQATRNASQAAGFAREMMWKGARLESWGMFLMLIGMFFCFFAAKSIGPEAIAWLGPPIGLAGVFVVEYVYIRAAQLPPLS